MFPEQPLLILFCLFLTTFFLPAQDGVKFLEWSWNNPTIDYLEENVARMNAECPQLDGLVIRVNGQEITDADGGKWTPGSANAWSKRRWEYAHFEDFVTRYRKLDMGHFTDNFFQMTTTHVDFDWLSDDECANMAHNFGVAAQVAKACGFKGLVVDIEEYGRHFWRFSDLETTKSEGEIAEIVFRRGQEWGRQVFGAYPDIVLFMSFCLSMPDAPLAIAFMNGVLDVMPPKALIYEGMESGGYAAKQGDAYRSMQDGLRKLIRRHVRPENRSKARGQILLAPAFYLDAYFVCEKGNYYHENLEPDWTDLGAVKLFSRCLAAASQEAEPYIWLYGEKRCWWKGSPHPANLGTWEEAPEGAGVMQALKEVKNPSEVRFDDPRNLVQDPSFQEIGVWELWQQEDDRKLPAPGTGLIRDGRCVMRRLTNGCYHQLIPCKPGQTYLFVVHGCVADAHSGSARASLNFKDAAGKWLPVSGNLRLEIPATGKPETVWGYVTSPANAASISVQCGAADQQEDGEVYFTGIYLREM
ncbi:MAG: hypothetical protein MJ202_08765 [Lentisphaeria bacterium]|nr:hypothetical protein [Lentisphaeria bacterium]